MIYKDTKEVIPQESRQSINDKILHVIETGELQGITQQDIYSGYSPLGLLHGLIFSDFNSFHEFTEAKKSVTSGQYFTPPKTSKRMVDMLGISTNDLVCDLTSGHGAFFNFLPNLHNTYGCELDYKAYTVSNFLYPNANITNNDVRQYEPNIDFDYMVLNPPFNLDFGGVSSQMYVCQKANTLLKPLGIIGLIVPKSFLNDEMMNNKDIEFMNNNFSFLGQIALSIKEFESVGVSNFETKMMFFQKSTEQIVNKPFENIFDEVKTMKNITDAKAYKNTFRAKNILTQIENDTFKYKVNKFMYEFGTHENLRYYKTKANQLVKKLRDQSKPEGMDNKEWDKTKLTENKVLSIFKRVMKDSYKKERDCVKLVKTSYGFSIKSYSKKRKIQVSKTVKKTHLSIVEILNGDNTLKEDAKRLGCDVSEYEKVISKKVNSRNLHKHDIMSLPTPKEIKRYTSNFKFKSEDNETYKLHKIQKSDIEKVITRDYTLLSWEQGVGKSVALLCVTKYILSRKLAKNVFITAPSIAINLTLKPFLETNNVEYRELKNASDIDSIVDGEVLLMTLSRVSVYKDNLTKYVKSRSNKVCLIFDESDEITNYSSKRTRSVMSIFRRCTKKVLMTGTVTRNNIGELYPNYELLYNNSYNMVCKAPNVYRRDSKSGDLVAHVNDKYNETFGAYFGFGLFKKCFSPSKPSVFGIEKELQDIYNVETLKEIINSTIITRTFEEVAGKKIKMNTMYVVPNYAEKVLQDNVMNDFSSMCYKYFSSTGNSRKESYLRIIRMINLLIKSTSTPHLMDEWIGEGLPTKISKVVDMVSERDCQILVGCVGIPATKEYFNSISEKFPNRKVFYIDGNISFMKRKYLIEEFKKYPNSIIVANQASLKSSVNIPECNEVIITALPWNGSKLSQFFRRCVRFNSSTITNVNLVCYSDSIELNVLNLILNKEKVNQFIKTTDITTDDDVNEQFGVDGELLGSLIGKHYDENGGMSLSWGEKSIRV